MSHYTVAVITKNGLESEVDAMLEPFWEELEVEEYIVRTREQIIEDGKKNREDLINRINECEDIDFLKKLLLAPYYDCVRSLLNAETDDDFFYAEASSDCLRADDCEYSSYNPEARWDWYQIGGRWENQLRDYNGNYHNTLKIADWDYNYIDPTEIKELERFWEVVVEGDEPTEEEKDEFITWLSPDYYREKYGNKSNYVKSRMTFSSYALLTPEGEWLEAGQMGWFGMSTANPLDSFMWERDYTNLIDTFDKNYYITLVDCHI